MNRHQNLQAAPQVASNLNYPVVILAVALSVGLCGAFLNAADEASKQPAFDPAPIVSLFQLLLNDEKSDPDVARHCINVLTSKIKTRELSAEQIFAIKQSLSASINKIVAADSHPLQWEATLLAAMWQDARALELSLAVLESAKEPPARRLAALDAVITTEQDAVFVTAAKILANHRDNSGEFCANVLAALGRSKSDRVAEIVLENYAQLEPDQQPKVISLLTQRANWSRALLEAVGANRIPASALNVDQVAKLQASSDPELVKLAAAKWGTVRTARNPAREQVVAEMKAFVRRTPGDAFAGQAVFKRVCAQCHKIYGEGADVGPDITANGRNDFNQLLSNVFDPSLVIGAAYQARIVRTNDGRILSGVPMEDNEQRVVLKVQGGKQEIIARSDIEDIRTSELSLMPEGLEKQLQATEIADLFSFLILDKPPSDPAAKQLPDVYERTLHKK